MIINSKVKHKENDLLYYYLFIYIIIIIIIIIIISVWLHTI